MLTRVSSFQTVDGKLFTEETKAVEHQFILDLIGAIQSPEVRPMAIPFQATFTPRQIAEIIAANKENLTGIISKYKTVRNRLAKKTNSMVRV